MPDSLRFRRRPVAGAAAAALLAASLGAPSAAAPPARPDPTDARSPVPPLQHQSAFSTYRRSTDTPVGAWRALNDATARAGGWRAYAREAGAEGAASAASAASTASAPAPAPASAPPSASAPASAPGRAAPRHHHHGGHQP
jgi:hypothetical protein